MGCCWSGASRATAGEYLSTGSAGGAENLGWSGWASLACGGCDGGWGGGGGDVRRGGLRWGEDGRGRDDL